MEKIVKSFTRDLSLCVTQWWTGVQKESYVKELGVGYADNPAASQDGSVAFFYLQKDLDAIKAAFLEKLRDKPEFYLQRRTDYLDAVRRLRGIKDKNTLAFSVVGLEQLNAIFSRLYPMYRYAIFIPSIWKEDVQRVLGSKAEATIAAAYEDRVATEGALEDLDAVFRRACAQKLNALHQPTTWAKWLTVEEVDAMANNQPVDWNAVRERTQGFIYCNGKTHAGKSIHSVFRQAGYDYAEDQTPATRLQGNVAFRRGQAQGRVRRVFNSEQADLVADGDILVAPMTSPDFLAAMKRASAIVTDEGGITCHAAIVSRELQKPCIVGTKSATRLFADGDYAKVDTHAGTVTKVEDQN